MSADADERLAAAVLLDECADVEPDGERVRNTAVSERRNAEIKSIAVRALAGGHATGPWPWPWPEPRPFPD